MHITPSQALELAQRIDNGYQMSKFARSEDLMDEKQEHRWRSTDALRSLAAQVETLRAYNATRTDELAASVSQCAALKSECDESDAIRDKLARLLAGVAIALKGDELPLHRHGYHDLEKCAQVAMLEIELLKHLKTQIEEERDAALQLAAERLVDAERLDWCQQNRRTIYAKWHEELNPEYELVFDGFGDPISDEAHPTIRAAIDAARQAAKDES